MNLSPHFTLEEMLASQSATRLGFDEQFHPDKSIKDNLAELCEKVLEPIREMTDSPIKVSSGYRCERVNASIGGVDTSQHCKGQAADITSYEYGVESLYDLIKNSDIEFDQLIHEFGQWVHISYTAVGVNRRQCLRAIKVDGHTKYIPDNHIVT